jgi:hypothetical protein
MESVSSHAEDLLRTYSSPAPALEVGVVHSFSRLPFYCSTTPILSILGKNWEEIGKKKYNQHLTTLCVKKKGGTKYERNIHH